MNNLRDLKVMTRIGNANNSEELVSIIKEGQGPYKVVITKEYVRLLHPQPENVQCRYVSPAVGVRIVFDP
jgi:hypothetical protein